MHEFYWIELALTLDFQSSSGVMVGHVAIGL